MIEIELDLIDPMIDADYVEGQLSQLGLRSQARIRSEMRSTPRTGNVYRRGGRFHVSSSSGNFPAIDTGRLAGSIEFDASPNEVRIGSGIVYAKYLEDGTRRMAARPFLEPGIDSTINDWPAFMSEFLQV